MSEEVIEASYISFVLFFSIIFYSFAAAALLTKIRLYMYEYAWVELIKCDDLRRMKSMGHFHIYSSNGEVF